MDDLARFNDEPPDGARLRPLQVAGAFHTQHMAPAVETLAGYARAISTHDARTRLLSNADGMVVQSGREYLARLVEQVSNPVRWDLCMQTMVDLGVTAFIEVPPAGTLSGLAKRAMPDVEVVALKTPDDLDAARELVARHGVASPLDASPTWRMLVSPSKGIFHRTDAEVGDELEPGATIGHVKTNRDEQLISAPHGGVVVEWLVEDGDPVSPGQPVVRLYPNEIRHDRPCPPGRR